MKDENNKDEIVIVKTTEKFRLLKDIFKVIIILIVSIIILYFLVIIFGAYFFCSFFLALILISLIFNNIYKAPGELVIECCIGSEKDENNKGDVLSIEKIPNQIYKEYESKGSNIKKFTTKSGKSITIVEKIDHINKKIIYPWFSLLSDFEFFIKKETYINLKKSFKNIMDDILKTKETRDLYRQLETIKLLDYYDSEKDIEEIKSKLEKK